MMQIDGLPQGLSQPPKHDVTSARNYHLRMEMIMGVVHIMDQDQTMSVSHLPVLRHFFTLFTLGRWRSGEHACMRDLQ